MSDDGFLPHGLVTQMLREITGDPYLSEDDAQRLKEGSILMAAMAKELDVSEHYAQEPEYVQAFQNKCERYYQLVGSDLSKHMSVQALLSEMTTGSHPRILLYELTQRKGKEIALLRASNFTGLLQDSPKRLSEDMDLALDLMEGENLLVVWVCPLPQQLGSITESKNPVFAYFRDAEGFEMVGVSGADGAFRCYAMKPSTVETLLYTGLKLNQVAYIRNYSRSFLRDSKTATVEMLSRPEQDNHTVYSVHEARAIAARLWDSPDLFLQRLDRHLVLVTQLASTNLDFAIRTVVESGNKYIEMAKQMEKDMEAHLARQTKRLRSDLERSEMMVKGVRARADRVEAENRELKRQLKNASSGQTQSSLTSLGAGETPEQGLAQEIRQLLGLVAAPGSSSAKAS